MKEIIKETKKVSTPKRKTEIDKEQAETLEPTTASVRKRYRVKRYHFGARLRLLLMFSLMIVSMLLAVFFVQTALSEVTVHQFFYSETSNLDFKTCLKENDYFTEKCLDKDKQYIANLIEYIDAEFKYNFSASDLFNYDYKYSITARVIATEKNNAGKVLYDNEEMLFESPVKNMQNSNTFAIKENISIDYVKYNELMNSFRKDYTLTLDGKLIVTLKVTVDGDYDKIDDKVVSTQNIDLTIPLSEQTIDISMNYKDLSTADSMKKESNNTIYNKVLYGLSGLFGLFTLILVALQLIFIKKLTKPKTNYNKILEKIMREYNQIIVETKTIPDFQDSNLINVDSFEELLDVRETIAKPILYVKIHNQKSYFLIVDGREVYRYVLKAVDVE